MLDSEPATRAPVLKRLDRLIWSMIAGVALFAATAPLFSNFRVNWQAFAAPALACGLMLAAAWFYRCWRSDARLHSALLSTAQVIAFAAVGAPLSYLAASANLPLHDEALATIDRALGLDWIAMLGWMNERPWAFEMLRPIYLSLTLQMTTVVLCLAFCGRHTWLRTFTLAFMLAALVCIAISALLPAAGAWPHYAVEASSSPHVLPTVSSSWPVFYGLRDGSFRTLAAVGSEGIISFPSLHAALAVIVVGALWPIPVLRWLFLVLNSALLLATPIDGSHYFIDVLAGIALAVGCLFAARTIVARAHVAPRRDAAELVHAQAAA